MGCRHDDKRTDGPHSESGVVVVAVVGYDGVTAVAMKMQKNSFVTVNSHDLKYLTLFLLVNFNKFLLRQTIDEVNEVLMDCLGKQ
jgi:hypothetical protein